MRPAVWESDAIKQKELFNSYNQETIQPHLKKIEQQLEENGSGYLVGNEVETYLILTIKYQIIVII